MGDRTRSGRGPVTLLAYLYSWSFAIPHFPSSPIHIARPLLTFADSFSGRLLRRRRRRSYFLASLQRLSLLFTDFRPLDPNFLGADFRLSHIFDPAAARRHRRMQPREDAPPLYPLRRLLDSASRRRSFLRVGRKQSSGATRRRPHRLLFSLLLPGEGSATTAFSDPAAARCRRCMQGLGSLALFAPFHFLEEVKPLHLLQSSSRSSPPPRVQRPAVGSPHLSAF